MKRGEGEGGTGTGRGSKVFVYACQVSQRVGMASGHREAFQKQIQQDWANREYIEVITGSIKKITDFLNSFGK